LSYNKNKSKKNYIKCTKFKVSTNFITNFYLSGIQKVLNFIQIPEGQVRQVRQEVRGTAIPEGQVRQVRQEVRGTAIPQVRQVMVMEKDRDSFSPTRCPT
jgi:hypothetical protein